MTAGGKKGGILVCGPTIYGCVYMSLSAAIQGAAPPSRCQSSAFLLSPVKMICLVLEMHR